MFIISVARLYASSVFASVGFTFPVVNMGLMKVSSSEYRLKYSSKGSRVTLRLWLPAEDSIALRLGGLEEEEKDSDALRLRGACTSAEVDAEL